MVKLSISLPNNTHITLESEETGVVHEVLGMVLSGMELNIPAQNVTALNVEPTANGVEEKSTVASPELEEQPVAQRSNGPSTSQSVNEAPFQPAEPATNGNSKHSTFPGAEGGGQYLDIDRQTPQAREDFRSFCQSLNAMGDMRRVVVAAEAAGRFFGWDGVSADVLGELFDLAGWRRANSFTQTLRNAARSKFGWLERIPGRSGRYAATDIGRSIIFGG